jgi:hypothetical protein
MVLRPLYLGFTILPTEPGQFWLTLGKPTPNFPGPAEDTRVKHATPRARGYVISARATPPPPRLHFL